MIGCIVGRGSCEQRGAEVEEVKVVGLILGLEVVGLKVSGVR